MRPTGGRQARETAGDGGSGQERQRAGINSRSRGEREGATVVHCFGDTTATCASFFVAHEANVAALGHADKTQV